MEWKTLSGHLSSVLAQAAFSRMLFFPSACDRFESLPVRNIIPVFHLRTAHTLDSLLALEWCSVIGSNVCFLFVCSVFRLAFFAGFVPRCASGRRVIVYADDTVVFCYFVFVIQKEKEKKTKRSISMTLTAVLRISAAAT